LLLIAILSTTISAQEYVSPIWQQDLMWTRLVGDSSGSYRIRSDINTGIVGKDATVRHSIEVKIDSWNKPFRVTDKSAAGRETLVITLRKTSNPKEMDATFEHVVYAGQRIMLKFAGVTRLVRAD